MALLARSAPRGLVLLSGDVHHAEIIGTRTHTCGEIVEVTTSGMTHSLATSGLTRFLFPPLLSLFSSHRPDPADYTTELNFALLNFDWNQTPPVLTISVRGTDDRKLLRDVCVSSCPLDLAPNQVRSSAPQPVSSDL